jgi:glycosyltransferase involved in cell wall biosynthesis
VARQIAIDLVHCAIINITTTAESTPRVLLLLEDQATGGVSTVSRTLAEVLRQRGWGVDELALNAASWAQRLAAVRRCDVLLASHNFQPAYIAWALGRLLGKPTVVWVHGPLQEVVTQAGTSASKQAWLRWLYRRLPSFVFVSQASRDSFDAFMGRSRAKHRLCRVITNAVALAEPPVAPPRTTDPLCGPIPLAYIGRLSPEKQPGLLLDMLRLLPERFRLTLLGDGPLRDTLRESGADLLASGRLQLAGAQPHGPGLYTPWRLSLLASRYEGCPMTLLESFAAGVPCVGLPMAALQEVLQDDAPYLLAREYSAQALADAVQVMCTLPPQQVQADMARVLARHRIQDFAQAWHDVLLEATRRC